MASDLKWRMGFGWGAVLFLICSALAALLFTGVARLMAIAAVFLTVAFTVHQYRKWNGAGWRQVHFRAMLAYSGIAGREHATAHQAGEAFDIRRACSRLGLLLCGEEKTLVVDAMLSELASVQGGFLAGLVERHAEEVLPGAPLELRTEIVAQLRALRFGPQLVIGWVIENTYGGIEAARYAVALVTGDAE